MTPKQLRDAANTPWEGEPSVLAAGSQRLVEALREPRPDDVYPRSPCCKRTAPWHWGSCSNFNAIGEAHRRDLCHSHPDPVNMPGDEVVCWECGAPRLSSRDEQGHAYCPAHYAMWGS